MNVISISWVRNEEDIIESFVRHNAQFTDHMVIVLHRSTDATEDILRTLHRDISLDIRTSNADYHAQKDELTHVMHDVTHAQNPQWILPLDADEFLHGTRGDIAQLSSQIVWTLPWRTYVPTTRDSADEPNPVRRICHRRRSEPRMFSKVLIPACIAATGSLTAGNHGVLDAEDNLVQTAMHSTLSLAHFPVRSERQLRKKILEGCAFDRRNPQRFEGQSFHWEHLYARCADPAPMTPEELESIALSYATLPEDPATTLVYDPLLTHSVTLHT